MKKELDLDVLAHSTKRRTTQTVPNMSDILQEASSLERMAIMTLTTCGEACWSAREEVCRCQCGGRNHGCLRTPDGVQPVRTSRIDGEMYELFAVGNYSEMYAEAEDLCRAVGETKQVYGHKFWWNPSDKGAPARLKAATKQQLAGWQELTAYRGMTTSERYFAGGVYLVWRKR